MSATLKAVPANASPWYQGVNVKIAYNEATATDQNNNVIFQGTLNAGYKPESAKYKGMDEYVGASPSGKNSLTALLVDHNHKAGGRLDLRGQDAQSGGTDFYTITSVRTR